MATSACSRKAEGPSWSFEFRKYDLSKILVRAGARTVEENAEVFRPFLLISRSIFEQGKPRQVEGRILLAGKALLVDSPPITRISFEEVGRYKIAVNRWLTVEVQECFRTTDQQ